ncbi:hypothetical protein HDV05_002273 [Chytridiales sp. JEL 0842]|nr:hypothetical protein HDV05_002273 [Chytridiales sp. JEL 0842]
MITSHPSSSYSSGLELTSLSKRLIDPHGVESSMRSSSSMHDHPVDYVPLVWADSATPSTPLPKSTQPPPTTTAVKEPFTQPSPPQPSTIQPLKPYPTPHQPFNISLHTLKHRISTLTAQTPTLQSFFTHLGRKQYPSALTLLDSMLDTRDPPEMHQLIDPQLGSQIFTQPAFYEALADFLSARSLRTGESQEWDFAMGWYEIGSRPVGWESEGRVGCVFKLGKGLINGWALSTNGLGRRDKGLGFAYLLSAHHLAVTSPPAPSASGFLWWFTAGANKEGELHEEIALWVAECYMYGVGVQKDTGKAVEWYRKTKEARLGLGVEEIMKKGRRRIL